MRALRSLVPLSIAAAVVLGACSAGIAAPGVPSAAAGTTPSPTTAAPATASTTVTAAPGGASTPAPAAGVGAGPIDACALLTEQEVAGLVKDATPVASGSDDGPLPTYGCTWDAAISDGMIPASIEVTATPGFVSGSGSTPEFISAMLQAEGSDPENGGRVVDGLGDIGIVTSVVTFDAEAKFLEGDTLVRVVLTRDDAPTQQDAVVELARAVASRLP